jgi:hypothetical protein
MFSGSRPRSITIWLALAGYVLVASGIPLPVGTGAATREGAKAAGRIAAKDRSRPFPCMNKPCGCANARQCFTKCCCNTPAETLVWARANGVDHETLASLERRAGVAVDRGGPGGDRGCCTVTAKPRSKPRSSCCDSEQHDAAGVAQSAASHFADQLGGNLAADLAAAPSDDSSGMSPPDDDRESVGLSLKAMLACGGIATEWLVVGASLPPPPPVLSAILVVIERRAGVDRVATGGRAAPEAPPPRAA